MSPPCSLLEWDTAFFAFPIARVTSGTLSIEEAKTVFAWCETNNVRCLYFLADPHSAETAETVSMLGFKMADARIDLMATAGTTPFPLEEGFEIRPSQASDVLALEEIARTAHTDSRFFFDQRFPRQRVKDMFAAWIARDCVGGADAAFSIVSDEEEIAGYITCSITGPGKGRIGLTGLAERFRGRGLGVSLTALALKWFASAGIRDVYVATQMKNVAAQRLYQKVGFRTSDVMIWYHKWWRG